MQRLKIGLSARFGYGDPKLHGGLKKNTFYVEQAFARWVQSTGALAFLIPDVTADAATLVDYASALDGLVLQGGSDISPGIYGEEPMRPEWAGDPPRDRYELELLARFMEARKPVLGVCRGQQLINVAFGGSLYQDTLVQKPGASRHQDHSIYDDNFHEIVIEPGTRLAALYPGVTTARVNTIHHQAVKRLGDNLVVEARSTDDDVIEAIRWTGPGYVFGVQWHPEFHDPTDTTLLDGRPILSEFLQCCESRIRPTVR
jgi:putative glutamine amidotransferase